MPRYNAHSFEPAVPLAVTDGPTGPKPESHQDFQVPPAAREEPAAVAGGHRGRTDGGWAGSLYREPKTRARWASLSIGKGWLLAVVLAGVLVLLLVLVLSLRGSM